MTERSERSRCLDAAVIAFALIAVAAVGGCVSGGGVAPDTPQPSLLSRLWPNEDGNSWTYDYVEFVADELRPVPEAITRPVDEISYAEVEALLLSAPPQADTTWPIAAGVLEMRLDGQIATAAGPKQHLRDTLFVDARAGAGRATAPRAPNTLRDERGVASVALASFPRIWGYSAFEKKDGWIGFYDTPQADSAYTLIREPLEPGAFFRHQINPREFDDAWQFAWVAGTRSIEASPGVFFDDAIAIVNVIVSGEGDYGFPEQSRFRAYTVMVVYFAPDVGPVFIRRLGFFWPSDLERPELRQVLFAEARLRAFDSVVTR